MSGGGQEEKRLMIHVYRGYFALFELFKRMQEKENRDTTYIQRPPPRRYCRHHL